MNYQDFQNPFEEPQPQKRSGCLRFWWVAALVVLLPIFSCVALGIFGLGMVKAPITAAVAAINENAPITTKLGGSVSAGTGFGIKDYKNNNGNGGANVDFNVVGPSGSAHVTGSMRLIAGEWSPEDITVECSDGTIFKIP